MAEGIFAYNPEPLILTKREYFAAMEKPDTEGYSISTVEILMGKKMPEFKEEPLAQMKYWAEFTALLKCISADALIKQLNETTP